MKTVTICLFCGCMLFANELFAQTQKSKLLPVATITAGSNIGEAVRGAFFSKFKKAENMRWFKVNQNYLVKFIMEDQEHQASFRKNGDFLYHISYGEEKHLPVDVRMQVKSKYNQYNIGRVFNVERDDRSLWIVNLGNRKHFITTSIENGNMNEIVKYKNATAGNFAVASNE
jgi:hypothetical protein